MRKSRASYAIPVVLWESRGYPVIPAEIAGDEEPGMRIYPLTDCCTLFGVNLKTLHKWLAREGIHPQQSRADTRIRYLTQEQVVYLAETYDRPLLQRGESATREPRASSAATLPADRLDQQEQRITQLETEMRQMQASMASFQQQTSKHTCVPDVPDKDQQTGQLEQSEKQKAGRARQPRAKVRAKARPKKEGGKGLPRSLVLLRVFAEQHHVPLKAADRASKAGKIAVVRGRWLVNSRYATEALGARGLHSQRALPSSGRTITTDGRLSAPFSYDAGAI